jgi:prepilin-type N-terminal cleavage/methylation domain-containing protein
MQFQRGITLIEMLIVVSIMALASALVFPSVNSGIDSLRLSSAANSIVSFLNSGLNRAERRQQVIEIAISRAENKLVMRSEDPSFIRELPMPEGVSIAKLYPELFGEEENERRVVLYPGGTVPRIGLEIVNRRGVRRIVRVDPMTGVPQLETPPDQQ